MSQTPAWLRQPNESRQAYEAFKKYLDLGPHRTLGATAEALGKSTRLIEKWSAKWKWLYRVQMKELEEDRERREAESKAIIDMSHRQAQIALMFQTKIIERLVNVNPEELAINDIPRWFEVAVKVERMARGLTDGNNPLIAIQAGQGAVVDIDAQYAQMHAIMAVPEARQHLEALSRTVSSMPVLDDGTPDDDDEDDDDEGDLDQDTIEQLAEAVFGDD